MLLLLTKTAISPLQRTFFFITSSFAPFVLSRWIWPLQLPWKLNPMQHHEVKVVISVVLMDQFCCGFTLVSLRGEIFTPCDTSGHLYPPHPPGCPPPAPGGLCRSRCGSTSSLHVENNICSFNCSLNSALPFLNCYTGQCFHQGRKAFQWEGGCSVPLKYCLQGSWRNPLSNTGSAYSCGATGKDRLEPIIYLFGFLLYFLPAWNNMYWK